jgi:hypothetical protein
MEREWMDDAGAFLAIGGRFHRQKAVAATGSIRSIFLFLYSVTGRTRGEGRVHGVRSS